MDVAISPPPSSIGQTLEGLHRGVVDRFGPTQISDVQILPKFVTAAKSYLKIFHQCAKMAPGVARAVNSTGLLSAISIPFTVRDVTSDVRNAAASESRWTKAEHSVKAISNITDGLVSVAGLAGGIQAITTGTAISAVGVIGAAVWTTPVTIGGMALLVGCTMITRGLAIFRTTRALMALRVDQSAEPSEGLRQTMATLAERDEGYLNEWFKTEKATELHQRIGAVNSRLQEGAQGAEEEAKTLIGSLKGRARTKMGREVAGIAMMIAAFAGAVLLTFTAATPLGWSLIGVVAVAKIAAFVFDRVYPRTSIRGV